MDSDLVICPTKQISGLSAAPAIAPCVAAPVVYPDIRTVQPQGPRCAK